MTVVSFGSINIDEVLLVDHIVIPGESLSALSHQQYIGGKGANQAVATIRAGHRNVVIAGCVGHDGIFIKEKLESLGIDTSFVTLSNEKTGRSFLQLDINGQVSGILSKGANDLVTREEIFTVLSRVCRNSDDEKATLLIQNEISNLKYLVETAISFDMYIIFNPSPFSIDIMDIFSMRVEALILNETEFHSVTSHFNIPHSNSNTPIEFLLEALIDKISSLEVLIVTLGAEGCCMCCRINGIQSITVNAYDVTPVDSTGAGDCFLGYFAHLWTEKRKIIASLCDPVLIKENFKNLLKLCNKAAGISTTRRGAMDGIPNMVEVLTASLTERPQTPDE